MFEGIVLKVTSEYSIVKTKSEYLKVHTKNAMDPQVPPKILQQFCEQCIDLPKWSPSNQNYAPQSTQVGWPIQARE